jgi:diaminopimelate decarboxylase
MLQNGRYAVVRRRQHFEEMIAGERPAKHWETT